MITAQDIREKTFEKSRIGGYDMSSVDDFLEELADDITASQKENAVLKSKMKVLVSKLEEYRSNEASMKDAIVNAQKTCDMMVREAEAKCTQMLSDANAAATLVLIKELAVMAENGIALTAEDALTRAQAAEALYAVSKLGLDAPGMTVIRMQQ